MGMSHELGLQEMPGSSPGMTSPPIAPYFPTARATASFAITPIR